MEEAPNAVLCSNKIVIPYEPVTVVDVSNLMHPCLSNPIGVPFTLCRDPWDDQ